MGVVVRESFEENRLKGWAVEADEASWGVVSVLDEIKRTRDGLENIPGVTSVWNVCPCGMSPRLKWNATSTNIVSFLQMDANTHAHLVSPPDV